MRSLRAPRVLLLALAIGGCAGSNTTAGTTASTATAPAPGRRMIPYAELAAAPVAPADHRLAYGPDTLQFGELRLPAGDARVPVVVLIHGGCWRAAYDLTHVSQAAAALTREGWATWTIEYPRVGDVNGGWPGTFASVARGVDHVRALAARFPRLDTTRVVLAGHSAGGQLALWAASRRAGERMEIEMSDAPIPVAGVVSLAGITDLRAYGAVTAGCNSAVTPLMGGTPAEVPARYAAVSPVERTPIGVPLWLVHGAEDPIVPVSHSTDLAERERAAGGRAEVTVVEGAGHFDLVAPQAEAWAAVVRAVRGLVGS